MYIYTALPSWFGTDKETWVGSRSVEIEKEIFQLFVPTTRRLFQSIQGLLEFEHDIWICLFDSVPFWWFDV